MSSEIHDLALSTWNMHQRLFEELQLFIEMFVLLVAARGAAVGATVGVLALAHLGGGIQKVVLHHKDATVHDGNDAQAQLARVTQLPIPVICRQTELCYTQSKSHVMSRQGAQYHSMGENVLNLFSIYITVTHIQSPSGVKLAMTSDLLFRNFTKVDYMLSCYNLPQN